MNSGMRTLHRKRLLFVLRATPRPRGTLRAESYSVLSDVFSIRRPMAGVNPSRTNQKRRFSGARAMDGDGPPRGIVGLGGRRLGRIPSRYRGFPKPGPIVPVPDGFFPRWKGEGPGADDPYFPSGPRCRAGGSKGYRRGSGQGGNPWGKGGRRSPPGRTRRCGGLLLGPAVWEHTV